MPICSSLKKLAAVSLTVFSSIAYAEETKLPPGFPDRSASFDPLDGFKSPPAGFGQVPFWWWSGEDLNEERLLWQLKELHEKGVSGVQVNYSHTDAPGWPSEVQEPKLFTPEWWKIYSRISEQCREYDMGIGLSTYTLDWDNGAENLFYNLFYSKPELNAIELIKGEPVSVAAGESVSIDLPEGFFAARAYSVDGDKLIEGGVDLTGEVKDGKLTTTLPSEGAKEWQVWTFGTKKHAGTLNPMQAGAGDTVAQGYFQKFEDNNPGKSSKGLNFFFNDELEVGLGKFAWNADFAAEFKKRKGYELLDVLPAMWVDMGDVTPKLRIDYADLRIALMEERYFEPLYNWHASRGIIFGCDNHGRGLQPDAYGDYYRSTRWYLAPGHDTPGGNADPMKGKVSSSIANLYQRPRVWLEGYHSLGWGATPENLIFATRENYLYGCTLLNLHGLYYTTRGSHWEWAPPCYHFRMPYWEHMKTFFDYFTRLSYVMSQGHHVCDVAIFYPVTPYEAELDGDQATKSAFELGIKLLEKGINFDFVDHQSISRAVVKDGKLVIPGTGASYKTLIFPDMKAARWANLTKALEFHKEGGIVVAHKSAPRVSDRAGANDAQLKELTEALFGTAGIEQDANALVSVIETAYPQDVKGVNRTVRSFHRRVNKRDVYMVMDAQPGDVVEFRCTGKAEIWDAWTGETKPLQAVQQTTTHTQLKLPLTAPEAQVIVFTPTEEHINPELASYEQATVKEVSSTDWSVEFKPTMNNTYGDFRLPVREHNKTIGVEARKFQWTRGNETREQIHGYGPQFFMVGPLPANEQTKQLEQEFAKSKEFDVTKPLMVGGKSYSWQPYEFSWKYGKFNDPGHQGFHGLKANISNNYIRLGESEMRNHGVLLKQQEDSVYFLCSYAIAENGLQAKVHVSEPNEKNAPYETMNSSPVNRPSGIYVNGSLLAEGSETVTLKQGLNPIFLRYDDHGGSYFYLRKEGAEAVKDQSKDLSMDWNNDPARLPMSPYLTQGNKERFSFTSAPGTTELFIPECHTTEAPIVLVDGQPAVANAKGHYVVANPKSEAVKVEIETQPKSGFHGGSVIPQPVVITTGKKGLMGLGDWSKLGALHSYSGGAVYSKTISLTEEEVTQVQGIDLGKVVATAEVKINGQSLGVKVCPPWSYDIKSQLKVGSNTVEVIVYNTLANHYQTIPTPDEFKGKPESGLMGPVLFYSAK